MSLHKLSITHKHIFSMNSRYFLLVLLATFHTYVFAQITTLSGTVTDATTKESLMGVSVYVPELSKGVVTNAYGYYSLSLPKDQVHNIVVTYIGYQEIQKPISFQSDIVFNIELQEITESLEEVVIEALPKPIKLKTPEMSVNTLSINTIKDMPVVLGETDVVKSILQLPGVTSAGEAASGFNVRGGAADQNLILLDEVSLFSSSHLFGLFSIFNPDAVKNLKLYKGGIPARYGSRIASVLDIYQKDGNYSNYQFEGGIGLLSSRLLAQGPIVKEKTSFLIGGRSSYAHLFFPLFDLDNKAYFYDLNLKINHKINDKNKLYLSSYFGKDVFSIDGIFTNTYGNQFVNLRWNHIFRGDLFCNTSLIYSKYFYGLQLNFVGFDWVSGIDNYNLKVDLVHTLSPKVKMRYGVNHVYYDFNPGKISPLVQGANFETEQLTEKYAFENGYYIESEVAFSDKWRASAGLRLSSFFRKGQKEVSIYENNQPVFYNEQLGYYQEAEAIDSFSYSRKKSLKDFVYLEPRFGLSYQLNDTHALKASYQRTVQYVHLISNTNSPTPLDIWAPSGTYLRPQKSKQVATGWFAEFDNATYSLSLESYYKTVRDRANYIDGAQLIANNYIERFLLFGESRSYGLELLFQKNKGNFKGWLAYTLSKSQERVLGRTSTEPGINNGHWFASNSDKTHDVSINASYRLNKRMKLNAAFNFQTGIPTTLPQGQYSIFYNPDEREAGNLENATIVPIYGSRNVNRLPNYHRLDLSLSLKPKKQKKIQSEWIFGVYNIYNRRNATSVSFSRNQDTQENEITQLSLFGAIPSVSYNFKF